MQKKLTVTIDEEVYKGLREVIGPRKISRFIEDLVRPHVTKKDIYAAYKEMAADEVRESEALEWMRSCQPVPAPGSAPDQCSGRDAGDGHVELLPHGLRQGEHHHGPAVMVVPEGRKQLVPGRSAAGFQGGYAE